MKRWAWLAAVLMLMLSVHVRAEETAEWQTYYEEQWQASGIEEVRQQLPEETKALLEQIGLSDLQFDSFTALDPAAIGSQLADVVAQQAASPLRTVGLLLGIVVLGAFLSGTRELVRESGLTSVYGVVCALACCAVILTSLTSCIARACRAAESVSVFMTGYVPVYAGVLLTSGRAVSATAYQAVVLFATEGGAVLATQWLMPLMTVSLAVGTVGAVTPTLKLEAISSAIHKACTWVLGLACTLLTGLLSIQSLIGGAADTLGGRAVKFSLSSFVPIVGPSLSEAFSSLQGCVSLLKTTVGAFGMISTALIVLPPLLECAIWSLLLSVCAAAADLFALAEIGVLIKTAQKVVKTLLALLAAYGLFMIVTTVVVAVAGGGTA